MRAAAFAAALVCLVLGLAACGGDSTEPASRVPSGTFVGKVDSSDAYVALVSDGERVTGYLCDGRRVSTWFGSAPVSDESAELESRRGDPLGKAAFADGGASGQVAIAGEPHAFAVEPAGGGAGLFRAVHGEPGEPGSVEAGWVVLADGSARGAKTSFIDQESDLVVQPAPRFMELGSDLAVDLGAGAGTAQVERVGPSFTGTDTDL